MCRNIRTLHNFEPSATDEEVHDAALQYVRKISDATERLLDSLVTAAPVKSREAEAEKRRARAQARYAA